MVLALSYAGCDIKRHPADDAIVTGVHSAVVEMNSVTDLSQTVADSTQGFIFYGAQANEYYPVPGRCEYSDGADIGFLLSEGPGDLGRLFLGPCIKKHECCDWTTMDDFLPQNQEEIFQFEHVEQSNGLIYYSLMEEEKEYQYDAVYPMCITGGTDMGLTYHPKIFRTPKEFTIEEVNWVEKNVEIESRLRENIANLQERSPRLSSLIPDCYIEDVIENLSTTKTSFDPADGIEVYKEKEEYPIEKYLEIKWSPASPESDHFTIELAIFKQENVIGRILCSASDTQECELKQNGKFIIPAETINQLPFTRTERSLCREEGTDACIHNNCIRSECSLMGRIIIKRTSENLIEMEEKGKYLLAMSRVDVEMGFSVIEPLDEDVMMDDDSWSNCTPSETYIP